MREVSGRIASHHSLQAFCKWCNSLSTYRKMKFIFVFFATRTASIVSKAESVSSWHGISSAEIQKQPGGQEARRDARKRPGGSQRAARNEPCNEPP